MVVAAGCGDDARLAAIKSLIRAGPLRLNPHSFIRVNRARIDRRAADHRQNISQFTPHARGCCLLFVYTTRIQLSVNSF